MPKKLALALFVVAAIATGLLVILLVGLFRVEEDGRTRDGAPPLVEPTIWVSQPAVLA